MKIGNKWKHFNDNKVKDIPSAQLQDPNAYILVYRKQRVAISNIAEEITFGDPKNKRYFPGEPVRIPNNFGFVLEENKDSITVLTEDDGRIEVP